VAYSKKNLNPGETVALDMHPHWWYFAEPAGVLLLSIIGGILVLTQDNDGAWKVLRLVVLALVVASAIWLVVRYLKWVTTHFVITSHRLMFQTGIIGKSGIQIPLERVNNVNFNQSVFERILGAGDLLIESGGEDGQSRYTDIRHPDRVQRLIHAQMEGLARRHAGYVRGDMGLDGGGAAMGGSDLADQLERLEGMMQRGTLSPEEFEAQKRRLLNS
jgi:membrane protein YdbS with pleckstrin-like domain